MIRDIIDEVKTDPYGLKTYEWDLICQGTTVCCTDTTAVNQVRLSCTFTYI